MTLAITKRLKDLGWVGFRDNDKVKEVEAEDGKDISGYC